MLSDGEDTSQERLWLLDTQKAESRRCSVCNLNAGEFYTMPYVYGLVNFLLALPYL